jgi:transposase
MPIQQGSRREQTYITSLDDFITPDNPVRLIDAFVDKLEIEKLGIKMPKAEEGRPAYHPHALLKLYLYGYLNRLRSSRRLERECQRNVEVRWLLQMLTPCYKTIADFRKDNAKALRHVFSIYTGFLQQQQLIEGKTLVIDGSKYRALNSKKNNFNLDKIERHQRYINNKTEEYLKALEENDAVEQRTEEIEVKRTGIQEQLKKLKERKIKYDELEQQIKSSKDSSQVSTTDPESRLLLINQYQTEVSYNVQAVADEKHKLVVHLEVTSDNDTKALYKTAHDAKEALQQETLTVIADKGYHTGEQLAKCEKENITTLVAAREVPSVKHLEEKYLVHSFIYNDREDTYTCPQGQTLSSNGNWYDKMEGNKRRKSSAQYRVKHYKTAACQSCPVMNECTKNKAGRLIVRSEHQQVVNSNNERVQNNKALYNKRGEIIEHIFGTVKRSWGYTYTLLKGKKKITGEFSLIYLAYNFHRTINILGFDKMMEALKNFKPEYPKGFCFSFFELYTLQFKPHKFFILMPALLKRAA